MTRTEEENSVSEAEQAVYMCVVPECDFKSTLSITFESKEFKLNEAAKVPQGPRDFSINYNEFNNFSDRFYENIQSLRLFRRKVDT